MDWKYIGATSNNSFLIDGVDICKEHWNQTNRTINVKDSLYGQDFTFHVYFVHVENRDIFFASSEFSNNIFGFYVES